MKHFPTPALLLLLLACALPVLAKDPPPPQGTPPAPDAAGFLESPSAAPAAGEPVEPEITIREGANQTIYEYRVRGRLYMTKIQPRVGPAYYMIDSNGDGTLDQRSSVPMDININQWLLFSWD